MNIPKKSIVPKKRWSWRKHLVHWADYDLLKLMLPNSKRGKLTSWQLFKNSYQITIIQMVTSKRRNRITLENLEVLLLLGTLKIPVKNLEDYENERKRLEKKKWTLNYFLFRMRLYCKLVQKRKLKKKNYMICSQSPLEKLMPP